MKMTQPLVDVEQLPWPPQRRAAAVAVAALNHALIAQAALKMLAFHDACADFAAWCDAQAPSVDAGLPSAVERAP